MWAQPMLALDRCGRRTKALKAYHRLRGVLAQETGLEPGAEVREVRRAVLEGNRAPAPAGADAGAGRPEVPVARMLPPALHDFSGRRAEPARIETVLRAERTAGAPPGPVTVSGPGGIGKTALAVQAAHCLGAACPDRAGGGGRRSSGTPAEGDRAGTGPCAPGGRR